MNTFADSSALVKLYARYEQGSAEVRAIQGVLRVSALTLAEVPAALWRKSRTGELSREDAELLSDQFLVDFHGASDQPPRFMAVIATISILDHAGRLAARHGLRAYDAVQLATAIAVRDVEPECQNFACFDKGLASAAQAEGFGVGLTRQR